MLIARLRSLVSGYCRRQDVWRGFVEGLIGVGFGTSRWAVMASCRGFGGLVVVKLWWVASVLTGAPKILVETKATTLQPHQNKLFHVPITTLGITTLSMHCYTSSCDFFFISIAISMVAAACALDLRPQAPPSAPQIANQEPGSQCYRRAIPPLLTFDSHSFSLVIVSCFSPSFAVSRPASHVRLLPVLDSQNADYSLIRPPSDAF